MLDLPEYAMRCSGLVPARGGGRARWRVFRVAVVAGRTDKVRWKYWASARLERVVYPDTTNPSERQWLLRVWRLGWALGRCVRYSGVGRLWRL